MPLAEPLPPPLDDAMAVLEEPPAEEVSLPPPLPGPLRKAKLVFCRLLGRPTPTISVVVQRGFQEASRERAAQIQRQCVVNFFCVATIQVSYAVEESMRRSVMTTGPVQEASS